MNRRRILEVAVLVSLALVAQSCAQAGVQVTGETPLPAVTDPAPRTTPTSGTAEDYGAGESPTAPAVIALPPDPATRATITASQQATPGSTVTGVLGVPIQAGTAVVTFIGTTVPAVSGNPLASAKARIKIDSNRFSKTFAPGQNPSIILANGIISVEVQFLSPLTPAQLASLQATFLPPAPPGWQIEPLTSSAPNSFSFKLVGKTAPVQLQLQVTGAKGVPPLQFGIQVTQGVSITVGDSGITTTLNVGDRVSLDLGTGMNWTIDIQDESIVSRVVNITPIKGSLGVYEARKVGRTVITASGDPPCRQSKPPCMVPTRLFEFPIVVEP